MVTLNLAKEKWELCGYWPYVPFKVSSDEARQELLGVTDPMPAVVPGSVHRTLLENGWIEDPFYSDNALHCEWVENRWWKYTCYFTIPEEMRGKHLEILLKGVDYKAHIFFQGQWLFCHEGMYTPISIDITDRAVWDEENRLEVLLEHAPDEMSQIGYTSHTKTQKARFNYKWDFSTRMVHLGIWDEVLLVATDWCRLQYPGARTCKDATGWTVDFETELFKWTDMDVSICGTIQVDGCVYSCPLVIQEGAGDVYKGSVRVPNPRLWYPHNMGKQVLYSYKIEVFSVDGGECVEQFEGRLGFCEFTYSTNSDAPVDSLPYTVLANGQAMYINGVNMVPLSLLYGDVTDSDYRDIVFMLKNMNVNLVRLWGGGLIEKDILYDLCDENGILIWQEFIQSSSGIENVPSKDPHFLELLRETATHAVKTKRRFTSLAFWSGGNELTDLHGVPATTQDANIEMLSHIVKTFDGKTQFLPTSASGPQEFLNPDTPGCNHDVHGPWKYDPVYHYDIFNRSDSLLHSEFGCDGNSRIESLSHFLDQKDLCIDDMTHNLIWRMHGEWWDTRSRVEADFGNAVNLTQFCQMSQWGQAEALRYAVDANKRRMFRNSGNIVWVFNEPYPNVSNTSLLDYYRRPKTAYYALTQSYAPQVLSLRYDNCVLSKEHSKKIDLFGNSAWAADVKGTVSIYDLKGHLLAKEEFSAAIPAKESCCLRSVELSSEWEVILVRLDGEFSSKQTVYTTRREYFMSMDPQRRFSALSVKHKSDLHWEVTGWSTTNSGDTALNVRLRNDSDYIAVDCECVYPQEWPTCVCKGDHQNLLPGETVHLQLVFVSPAKAKAVNSSDIAFRCLNQ